MWKDIKDQFKSLFNRDITEKEADPAPKLHKKLDKNKEYLDNLLGDNGDITIKEFNIAGRSDLKALMVYVDGMISKALLNEQVLTPLMHRIRETDPDVEINKSNLAQTVESFVLSAESVSKAENFDDVVLSILSGETALFFDGDDQALIISARGWPSRGIQEPATESVIRGPRDGFTETIRMNTVLIRRRIRDPNLKIQSTKIGRRTKTDVALAYVKGIANKEIINEVKARLDTIDIDQILETGYIEQLIEDSHYSPFPQIQVTERPDKVVGSLLEGRVAILVDNTPMVLLVPVTFSQLYQSPEDYNERWLVMSAIRILRFTSIFISALAPALFIALTSFHPGMIPTELMMSVAATREGVPFPAFIEAGVMEVTIELLREAGIRLPGPIGQTIGIVGGLVIGQAAVSAKVASPIMVIVVAITAIASFITPSYNVSLSIRFIRFGFMILAAVLGLYGMMLGVLAILIHLVTLKSFGVPYLSPLAPYRFSDWKDDFIRAPTHLMTTRPKELAPQDPNRQDIERENNKWGEEDND
ncbi:spore germination protein [Selenihalanaerobacter shriftii]|uniref:Spore germination protein n=1 Tax=Selenihalanaerobacter shriftii TaxID=142842 RepID=A0A1T4JUU3_9FIRM|nr:spore germination protein [Selenihalanaerobacter shriftii]SJZ33904.1 spore germination protein [Selenihalanaerobacter shriftii]